MPFPPTPSNTPSNTATPSNTPSNTPAVTPSNSSCFPPTPTPTPTITPTGKEIVYISVCTNPMTLGDGTLLVNVFADTVYGSFGHNPINVNTDVDTYITISAGTTNDISGYITMFSGSSYGSDYYIDYEVNVPVYLVEINLILPSESSTQIYLYGGVTFSGSCGIITPTPTPTPTNTETPTNTPTPTPTETQCQCYYYNVITYEQDILRATGNTGTNLFRNGLVWVSYRNCDDTGFTDATFDNTASPYENAVCVNALPLYNPPTIFIWQDNVQTTEILSFVEKAGCCS